MSKEDVQGAVPRLRFPEFRGAGAWKDYVLSKVSPSVFDGTHQTPNYTEHGVPFFSVENIVSGSKNKFISQQDFQIATSKNKPEKGDILLTRIGKIGFSAIVDWDYDFSVYVTLAVIKQSKLFDSHYLHYFFQSDLYQSEIQSRSLLNAVPAKINMDELRRTKVLLPASKLEQQKIADCLSSLDETIGAESEKLEALKAHKRGLMQGLFPAEGETEPRLRFREFEEEWESHNFYSLLEEVMDFRGRTPAKIGMDWGGGKIVSLSANNVKNGYIDFAAECNFGSDLLYEKWMGKVNLGQGDIVFTMEAPLGKALLIPDGQKYILSQRVVAFKTKPLIENTFLIQIIWSEYFQAELLRLSTGSTAKGINQKTLSTIDVKMPKRRREQQKIAFLLSSLDELITAQSQKIEALKTYKRGLMQALFPTTASN